MPLQKSTVFGIVILIVSILHGAIANGQDELPFVGRWKIDAEATKKVMMEYGSTENEIDSNLELTKSVVFEFSNDKSLKMENDGKVIKSATWSATASEDKGSYTLKLKLDDHHTDTGRIQMLEAGKMKIIPSDQPPAIFVREKMDSAGKPFKELLIGTWSGDVNATKAALKDAGTEDDEADQLSQRAGVLSVNFKQDGRYTLNIAAGDSPQEINGAYTLKVLDADKGTYDLTAVADESDGGETVKFTISSLNKDRIQLTDERHHVMIFSRKQDNEQPAK